MSTSRVDIRNGRRAVALLLALPALGYGCSSPTAPAPPPAGGGSLNLNFAQFQQSVQPVLMQQGCDAEGDCHGGGIRGSLQLSPPGAKDDRFDFDQVVLQTSWAEPENSPILTEPLAGAAGGTPHSFEPFATTADSGYLVIRQWVLDGVTP
jgi:hypothetical protein